MALVWHRWQILHVGTFDLENMNRAWSEENDLTQYQIHMNHGAMFQAKSLAAWRPWCASRKTCFASLLGTLTNHRLVQLSFLAEIYTAFPLIIDEEWKNGFYNIWNSAHKLLLLPLWAFNQNGQGFKIKHCGKSEQKVSYQGNVKQTQPSVDWTLGLFLWEQTRILETENRCSEITCWGKREWCSGFACTETRREGNQVLERRNPHSCQEEKAGGGQKPELDGQPSGPRRLGERFDPIGDY